MALSSWKSFNFFSVTDVRPADEPTTTAPLFEGADITSLTAGSDNIFLGTSTGLVHVVSSGFKVIRTFPVTAPTDYDHRPGAVTHLKQLEGTALLITICEDLSSEPVLKVWALDELDKKTGHPLCKSTLTVNNGRKQFPTTAFATTPSLSLCAVGFANGSITLIRGDLIHDRGTRQRIIFESDEPITNLCFSPPPVGGRAPGTPWQAGADGGDVLYVSTIGRILTLVTTGKGLGQPARVLESQGCGVGCMAPALDPTSEERGLVREGGDIVVAREDALYFYGPNGRGACYSYEGPKQLVRVFKNYIALVSPPASRPSTAVRSKSGVSETLKRFVGKESGGEGLFETTKFTLLDTELKFIAHTERLISGVREMFISWGDLFVLTLDGKVHRYHEVGLQEKLDILYARNLYIPAISLAKKAKVPDTKLRGIYRRYADYLYGKGDYDGSMQWYIKSLGSTNEQGVSNVIRKFLDTQRIHNLIEFLEELHRHGSATSDHTTLLLNCYAKLKDIDKLEAFIKQSPEEGLKFDVDTAISMCRQAGYYDQAVYLAEKQQDHDVVISILVENQEKYDEGLAYIRAREPDVAYSNFMRYARVFLANTPQKATDFFVEYYSGKYTPRKQAADEAPAEDGESKGHDKRFAYINSALLQQLPYMGGTSNAPSPVPDRTPPAATPVPEAPEVPEKETKYRVPRPRTAFSSFVDHPVEFISFLEQILSAGEASGKLSDDNRIDIYTTLFEMYLQRANASSDPAEKRSWEQKATQIIESKETLVDTSNVLLLSHLASFATGTTLVREKHGLRFDIFRAHCSANDIPGAIAALKKYGPEDPGLYPLALQFYTSSPDVLRRVGEAELDRVLKIIDSQNLMKPLQVVQALSTNAVATVGMVKRYLGDTIEKERREIARNRLMVEQYRAETKRKTEAIRELGSKPVQFQAQRCAACAMQLELPAVHFLCKHSYHQRCLNVGRDGVEMECQVCAPENQTIRTLRRGMEEGAERHEYFLEVLAGSRDGFGTVAEWFGRGVMVDGVVGFE